ncbi:helix-turn-helix domain-containing protein [Agromyces sp. Marseille-Q5079]|uniref:helix-turn-helix domain-containing protein n=1 Tax=Agromyces sp. Marseille-Q5079 TaxID=3439059 RepID=UPI003D9CA82E
MTRDNELNSSAEVAEVFDKTPEAMTVWRHRGGGPPYLKIGRRVYYRSQDVRAFIDAQATIDPAAANPERRIEADSLRLALDVPGSKSKPTVTPREDNR